MVSLLEKCHRGEIVSPEASKEIIATLRLAQDTERMTRYLVDTPGVSVAHKPGAVDNAKTDAGIMFFKGGPGRAVRADGQEQGQRLRDRQRGQRLHRQGGEGGVRLLQPRRNSTGFSDRFADA